MIEFSRRASDGTLYHCPDKAGLECDAVVHLRNQSLKRVLNIILFSNAVSAIATWMKLHFVWMNNRRLSSRLFGKYLSMSYTYFIDHNSSDLSNNNSDHAAIKRWLAFTKDRSGLVDRPLSKKSSQNALDFLLACRYCSSRNER
jgi:hypothetical protein